MKLMCLAEDETLAQQVCHESDRLKWKAMHVRDREGLLQAVSDFNPDLLVIEMEDHHLDWWSEAVVPPLLPVIFLNQSASEDFVVAALNSGADAFLPKSPFSPRQFEARVRALLRRQGMGQNKRFVSRLNLFVDSERYSVEIDGELLDLTLTEFKILRELASDETKVVSRADIQVRVFGQARLSNRSLDVHICALRKKIKNLGLDIDSVRGVGYQLDPVGRP